VGREIYKENEEYVMEKFEIRPASRVHCTQLAPRLRPSDKLEIHRASGQDPLEALLESIRVSD
jgi:hypothetical protein